MKRKKMEWVSDYEIAHEIPEYTREDYEDILFACFESSGFPDKQTLIQDVKALANPSPQPLGFYTNYGYVPVIDAKFVINEDGNYKAFRTLWNEENSLAVNLYQHYWSRFENRLPSEHDLPYVSFFSPEPNGRFWRDSPALARIGENVYASVMILPTQELRFIGIAAPDGSVKLFSNPDRDTGAKLDAPNLAYQLTDMAFRRKCDNVLDYYRQVDEAYKRTSFDLNVFRILVNRYVRPKSVIIPEFNRVTSSFFGVPRSENAMTREIMYYPPPQNKIPETVLINLTARLSHYKGELPEITGKEVETDNPFALGGPQYFHSDEPRIYEEELSESEDAHLRRMMNELSYVTTISFDPGFVRIVVTFLMYKHTTASKSSHEMNDAMKLLHNHHMQIVYRRAQEKSSAPGLYERLALDVQNNLQIYMFQQNLDVTRSIVAFLVFYVLVKRPFQVMSTIDMRFMPLVKPDASLDTLVRAYAKYFLQLFGHSPIVLESPESARFFATLEMLLDTRYTPQASNVRRNLENEIQKVVDRLFNIMQELPWMDRMLKNTEVRLEMLAGQRLIEPWSAFRPLYSQNNNPVTPAGQFLEGLTNLLHTYHLRKAFFTSSRAYYPTYFANMLWYLPYDAFWQQDPELLAIFARIPKSESFPVETTLLSWQDARIAQQTRLEWMDLVNRDFISNKDPVPSEVHMEKENDRKLFALFNPNLPAHVDIATSTFVPDFMRKHLIDSPVLVIKAMMSLIVTLSAKAMRQNQARLPIVYQTWRLLEAPVDEIETEQLLFEIYERTYLPFETGFEELIEDITRSVFVKKNELQERYEAVIDRNKQAMATKRQEDRRKRDELKSTVQEDEISYEQAFMENDLYEAPCDDAVEGYDLDLNQGGEEE